MLQAIDDRSELKPGDAGSTAGAAPPFWKPPDRSGFEPAVVVAARSSREARVRLADGRELGARLALPPPASIASGDQVLVAAGTEGAYVIGVLERASASAPAVTSRDGATARLVEAEGEERLEVRDPRGRLLFEYQPESGRGVLSVPAGDLELRAPEGSIELAAGRDVRVRARGGLRAEGDGGVRLAAGSRYDGSIPSLDLGRRSLALRSPRLDLSTGSGFFLVGDAVVRGRRLASAFEQVKLVATTLETVADRIFEKAKDVYRQVRELHQLEAGRARTLIRGAYYLLGKRTYLEAEEAVKIDGERIDLG